MLKILNYIKYGRYRPLNLVESFMAQLISLFCIKKSKNYSFHVLRYKKSPASTRYYNKLGRAIITISNFLTIILFNKIFIKGIGRQEEFSMLIHPLTFLASQFVAQYSFRL